jgi:leader peptidase (prepilin peptidase)/N-methyltransferase
VGVDPLSIGGAFLVGLAFGSFLNVCILRLPHDLSLVRPPSSCPQCRARIGWRDNIPVLSWLLLRGRCRHCGQPISVQYPLIELLVGAIWGGAVVAWGPSLHAVSGAVLATILLGIAVTDARHFLIPDEFTWGGLVLGLAFALADGGPALVQALLGAVAGFALLWAIAVLGEWVFKEEAMGGGDIKMMAMVGAFVGWRGVLLTVFVGALLGTLIFVPLTLRRKQHVPFGVFLALGAVVTFVAGGAIVRWYGEFLRGF